MKIYFRLLSFAKPIEKFAIPYIITTLFAIVFNTFLFTLLGPIMNTIFLDGNGDQMTKVVKESSLNPMKLFGQYVDEIIVMHDKAVSYTHLDVYKRQVYISPKRDLV